MIKILTALVIMLTLQGCDTQRIEYKTDYIRGKGVTLFSPTPGIECVMLIGWCGAIECWKKNSFFTEDVLINE